MPKCLRTEDDLRQVGMCKGLHGLAPIPVNELLQGVLDTMELIHLLLCHLTSTPLNSRFSPGQ